MEFHESDKCRRLGRLYKVAAFLPLAFIPAAGRLGAIGVAITAVVAIGLVVFLWRNEDRADVVRVDGDGLAFVRRDRVLATVPWAALRSIGGEHRSLRWRWDGGKIDTVGEFADQQALFAEVSRRAPGLVSMPDLRHRS